MDGKINELKKEIESAIRSMYPDADRLSHFYYTVPDLADQVVFELLRQDYREHAKKQSVQAYINEYDPEADNRKYTRAIQYAQHFRNIDNDKAESMFGVRSPELEEEDMSGQERFKGYELTLEDFLGLKLHTESRLIQKLHGRQIDKSKNVSEEDFRICFDEYSDAIRALEPPINKTENVIPYTLVYYGLESYFHIGFLYEICKAAARHSFPKEVPADRVLAVIGMLPEMPPAFWCPPVYFADCNILLKRSLAADDIFTLSNEEWLEKDVRFIDCKQMKSFLVQQLLESVLPLLHACTEKEKTDFIIEHYWIWDMLPDFEWPEGSIPYFRKLHAAVSRKFEKPHIK